MTFGSCLPVEVAVIALLDFINLGKQRQEREAGRKAVKIYLCFFARNGLKEAALRPCCIGVLLLIIANLVEQASF